VGSVGFTIFGLLNPIFVKAKIVGFGIFITFRSRCDFWMIALVAMCCWLLCVATLPCVDSCIPTLSCDDCDVYLLWAVDHRVLLLYHVMSVQTLRAGYVGGYRWPGHTKMAAGRLSIGRVDLYISRSVQGCQILRQGKFDAFYSHIVSFFLEK